MHVTVLNRGDKTVFWQNR